MKRDFTEYLGFDDEEEKRSVGRPKLADKDTKKKSIIFATISFLVVVLLLIFGYGTLFGFRNINLKGSIAKNVKKDNVLVEEIKPLVKDITLKAGTARKVYLTVLPATAANKEIDYISSDNSVAIVDGNGKVTGISVGNVTITATTKDGSNLSTKFNVTVIKNATGKCEFNSLVKSNKGITYNAECNNAVIKDIQFKVGNGDYEKLLTKKLSDEVKFSKEQMEDEITFKVTYYQNNSKVTNYTTKSIVPIKKTTTSKNGSCSLEISDIKTNSARYDINCDNASVTKIAYKIGNGSYVGLEASGLADIILFEESDVTRVLYINVEYQIDGAKKTNNITKSSIIDRKINIVKSEVE